MNRYATLFMSAGLSLLLFASSTHAASIKTTKHDLSVPVAAGGTGPGPIQSNPIGGTKEICVFCHTPHGAASITNAPLWNKSLNVPAYEVYTSDVLSTLSYPNAEQPLPSVRAVHLKTRLCLTCHDGTIALGQLANVPPGIAAGTNVPMVDGGASITTMPDSAVGYIGIELQDDHPVAIPYTNATDSELAASPGGKVAVFGPEGGNYYVECTSCHDPHDDTNTKFLVDSNAGSNICKSCHSNKTGYSTSVHATAGTGYSPPDGIGPLPDIGATVGEVQCMGCHFPHKAGITDTTQLPRATPADLSANPEAGYYLLSFQEEVSCFNNTDRWGQTSVAACHGTNSPTKNIESLVAPAKYRAHWVGNYTSRHLATEAQLPVPGNPPWFGAGNPNEHVECQDCHNPHTAGNTNHAKGTNQVTMNASPLYGTGGVTPGTYPAWNPGSSTGNYTPIQPRGVTSTTSAGVTYEYEICFKCHSDFAWNPATPPNSISLGASMTNQAMEFGNNATSSHPVVNTVANNEGGPSYLNGWTNGLQNMYCSDCHNNDLLTPPLGPHGSSQRSILFKPFIPSTVGQNSGELCFDCHSFTTYNSADLPIANTGFRDGTRNLHYWHMNPAGFAYQGGATKTCTKCHINPIHGSDKYHLLSYVSDPAPYGTYSLITNYIPTTPGSYTGPSCSTQTCHAGAVHGPG